MLSETGAALRAIIAALLDDILPVDLANQQKIKRASNLLAKMKDVDKTTDNDSVVGKNVRWRVV